MVILVGIHMEFASLDFDIASYAPCIEQERIVRSGFDILRILDTLAACFTNFSDARIRRTRREKMLWRNGIQSVLSLKGGRESQQDCSSCF
jgi:hypothetical protein